MPFKLSNFEVHKGSAEGPILKKYRGEKIAMNSGEIEDVIIPLHYHATAEFKCKVQITWSTKWVNYRKAGN